MTAPLIPKTYFPILSKVLCPLPAACVHQKRMKFMRIFRDQATDYTVSLTAENTKSASVFDVQSLITKSSTMYSWQAIIQGSRIDSCFQESKRC